MSQEVVKCSESTLVEAFALMRGVPATYDESEVHGLDLESEKKYPNIRDVPSLAIIQDTPEPQPAFWVRQRTWSEKTLLTRYGHKYLSVHFLNNKGTYEKYNNSLKKEIESWINLYKKVLVCPREEYLANITFGYVNEFNFDEKDDLTEYFKLTYGVSLGDVGDNIERFSFSFSIPDKKTGYLINMKVNTKPSVEEGKFTIRTEFNVYTDNVGSLTFNQPKTIMKKVEKLKDLAKKAFFGFSTEEAHELMGVEYADGTKAKK